MKVPKNHPRYESLKTREKVANGMEKGIVYMAGLIAHGRGESFDYLLGEKTMAEAKKSIKAAAALLLLAKYPVISVNGNTAALVSKELAQLSNILKAPLEVNIFHASKKRELLIKKHLIQAGAKKVLLPQKKAKIKFLESNRKYVNKNGIYKSDVVFVPLEDGDRTEALIRNGKKVIVVDLNPLSRSSERATITIVDNIVRAAVLLIKTLKKYKNYNKNTIERIFRMYNNEKILKESLNIIKKKKFKKKKNLLVSTV